MRKFLLSTIVLFTIGQMCKAQQTLVGQALKTDPQVTKKEMTIRRMPAPDTPQSYWVNAKGYFNEWGQFDNSSINPVSYQSQVEINGTEVTISNFVDMSSFTVTEAYSVHGTYDAAAKTITIQAPRYDDTGSVSDYTALGKISYFGEELTVVLFAGNFSDKPNAAGMYELTTVEDVVFDVDDNLSTMTARSGFGAYSFNTEGIGRGFVNYYKSSTFNHMTEVPNLYAAPDTVFYNGAAVTVGSTNTRNIVLSNMGLTGTNYTAQIEGVGLQLYASDYIAESSSSTYQLRFKPQTEGDYLGKVTFVATNGSKASVIVKGFVHPAPDLSSVCKPGDGEIVFSFTDGDSPFVVTDTITGYPVAVSTNDSVSYGNSSLVANIMVPEGKIGVLSWKGQSITMQPNGTRITADEEEVFDNIYSSSGVITHEDIANTYAFAPGDHTIQFTNIVQLNFFMFGSSKEPFRTYVYDLQLKLYDADANVAVLKEKDVEIDFGKIYHDVFDVEETRYVELVNLGTNRLKLNSSTGDNGFVGIVDGQTADHLQTLKVPIRLTTSQPGVFQGAVTLSTNAGDFTVNCKAEVVQLPYDYHPIVTAGEFSFNTSLYHPFIVDGSKAYSSTANMSTSEIALDGCWLEAWFKVEDNQMGRLSWDGWNSSNTWFIFMGDSVITDGTFISIDGGEERGVCGETSAKASKLFTPEELTFGPGLHVVKFRYQKKESKPAGSDRFELSKLSLTPQTGVTDMTVGRKEVVRTEYFNTQGMRIQQPTKGINVVRTTYADGTSSIKKIMVR